MYRDATTGQTLTIDVRIPIVHGGKAYYKVTGYTESPAYLRQAENGNIVTWDEELGRETLVTSFERVPRGWYDTRIGGCEQGAQVQEGVSAYKPANLPDLTAIQIIYRNYGCADSGINTEQYAENIGLLRRVVNTLAGPRTYDLVRANIGAVTYHAERGNAFRVSIDNNYVVCGTHGAEQLTVGMLASRHAAPWMELRFPSAQRYDIRVRNEAGEVVYQWSDDFIGAQAGSTVVLDRDLEYRQAIPLRNRNGQTLEGGYYTVEAWLTTVDREFSGATRFFYSPCEPAGPGAAAGAVLD